MAMEPRLHEARRLLGLGFQVGEQVGGVLGQPGEVASRPELADQPGRVPRRATRELLAFEQHDIGAITLGEVVGNAASDDAPADDHDTGMTREIGHGKLQ